MDLNSKIGVLGGGVEGQEVIRYLGSHGYKDVTLYDERDGADYLERAADCEVVFRSPGIHVDKLAGLRAKGVQITSVTKYFFEKCPCPIIGVTGTKGKGTTSTLIYLMLKEAGYDAYLGGNIGEPPLKFLDSLKLSSLVVLELSSFQLQDLEVSPHIAVVLRVSSDHLDYHRDRQEYMAAKKAIVQFQKPEDFAIFNEDYEEWKIYSQLTPAKKYGVSRESVVEKGSFVKEGKLYFANDEPELVGEVSKIALLGPHNLENVLPAMTVAKILEISDEKIRKILYSFVGLPHRLEFVREVNGVKYYNDSFSTTPETSVAAASAFAGPVILIAGGSEKGADYTEWATQLQKNPNLQMVILMGVTAEKMEKALKEAVMLLGSSSSKIYRAAKLEEAVKIAADHAQKGDHVVMSPAAASLDMFKNYKERGEKFNTLVLNLT